MNTLQIKLWYDEGDYLSIYSVQKENLHKTEADFFFEEYAHSIEYRESIEYLVALIKKLVNTEPHKVTLFLNRHEDSAFALPPKPSAKLKRFYEIQSRFPLRIYCYRPSEKIIFLFNGGIKESGKVQESPKLRMKFYEAQSFIKRIQVALQNGVIRISNGGRYLLNSKQENEIYI